MAIAAARSTARTRPPRPSAVLYFEDLFGLIAEGKTMVTAVKGQKVFSQGDRAEAIYFIQSGKVKLTVVPAVGREVVLSTLGPRGFLGEGCLVGQTIRVSTATAMKETAMFRIERRAMLRALAAQPELSEKFMTSLLTRNIDLEEDLCDQLFDHSEKRLARILLKLARFGHNETERATKVPRISHTALAEMVGITRSRVTHFMDKFLKLGLIECNGEITVKPELLTDVVLHD